MPIDAVLNLNSKIFLFRLCIIASFFLTGKAFSQTNQTVTAGSQTAAITFPSGSCDYQWTNDNSSIGLAASGVGNIGAFTTINNGSSPVVANVTVTPVSPQYAYLANFGGNNVVVVDIVTNTIAKTINTGTYPVNVSVSPDGKKVYITNPISNQIEVIDAATQTLIATISSGLLAPQGIAVTPDGSEVYIVNTNGNNVVELDGNTNSIINTIPLSFSPFGIISSPDGSKLYISNSLGGVSVMDRTTHAITNLMNAGGATFEAISADGSFLYLIVQSGPSSSIGVYKINTTTGATVNFLATGAPARGIVLSPDGSRLYVSNQNTGTITVINTSDFSVITTFTVGTQAEGVSITPDGKLLYVCVGGQNSLVAINTSDYKQTASVAIGTNAYSYGNFIGSPSQVCTSSPVTFSITVNPDVSVPLITTYGNPAAVSTVYGTASPFTNFTVSGTNLAGPVTVKAPADFEISTDDVNFSASLSFAIPGGNGVPASKPIYIRLIKNAPAGTYSGTINISSPNAADVQVAMPLSTVQPFPVTLSLNEFKYYGQTLSNYTATADKVGIFIQWNSSLPNNEMMDAVDVSFMGGGSAATDPAGLYKSVVYLANVQGTNGFLISNYKITYQTGDITVEPSLINITATAVNKPASTGLTNGQISSGYTVSAMPNGETITSVAVTYGNGAAPNAPTGTYDGSVVLSNAVGANGFMASNYFISYLPAAIVVYASGAPITATGNLTPLSTIYGTYSSAETFTVAATGLPTTTGVLVTPPAGFEVSTNDINYSPTLTIGAGSNSVNQTIFIRLAKTTNAGIYSGNIVISSSQVTSDSLAMPASTVVPAPLTLSAQNTYKVYGTALPPGPGHLQFGVSAGSLQNGETISSVTIVYLIGDSVKSVVGTYVNSVNVSQPVGPGTFLASNYNISYVSANLIVQPAVLTVTANPQSRPFRQPNPPLTYQYSGFVNGEDSTVLVSMPVATTAATLNSPSGQYPINVSGGLAANYSFAYVSSTLTITVVPGLQVTIPNAFTPNNDGINDTWNINNLINYDQCRVQIFNRNGTLIYNSTGYTIPWDGTLKGGRVPDGTYYYVITLTPGEAPLSGFVAVIR